MDRRWEGKNDARENKYLLYRR